jgi:protein involved in polysaccharide export with SLBB domain
METDRNHIKDLRESVLFRHIIISVFVILLSAVVLIAQEKSRSLTPGNMEELIQEKSTVSISQPQGVALESAIDGKSYYVGPSDVFSVNVWMSPPLNFLLTVTPEGTLIIPTVGEVRVTDMLLADAKAKIIEEIRKKYITTEITATLTRPRPIIVTVTGNVLNGGLYTLTSIDRANKAIEEANKPNRLQTQLELEQLIKTMSTRNIMIKHRDGGQDRVDLEKFLATKEDRWNPYLREGDVIVVPRKNPLKNVIGIYGEVNSPGRYEFVDGDTFLDAMKIGMGFTRLAITDSVEFSRLDNDGKSLTTAIININEMNAGKIPDFSLEPGDRIVVKARKELREDYRVTIEGEVLFPGTYPITKNRTKLTDIIKVAGGFTEFALLKSAELNRKSVEPTEVEKERLMSYRGGVLPEDSSDYFLETEVRLRKEIVNVDFEKLFLQGDSTQDVYLQSEDIIIVPSVKKTIYVFGQVVSPGHIPFMDGMNAEYYVMKAGGFTDRAREGDMKIIKGKTKQWLDPDETKIEDGDYVWVPKNPERPFAYYMTIASQAASVLSVIIGIAVVIVQVTK